MKTWFLFLLVLLLSTPVAHAQQRPVADHLAPYRRALALARTDTARGRLYVDLGWHYNNTDSLGYYGRLAIRQLTPAVAVAHGAERRRLLGLLAQAYDFVAVPYSDSNDSGQRLQALRYYKKALALAQQAGNVACQVLIYTNLGTSYANGDEYASALQTLREGVRLGKDAPPSPSVQQCTAACLSRLGCLYQVLDEDSTALRYQLQALELVKSPGDHPQGKMALQICLTGLVDTYQDNFNDTAQAGHYARWAWAAVRPEGSKLLPYRMLALNQLGAVYRQEKRWRQARMLLLEAETLAYQDKGLSMLSRIQANLAMVAEGEGHLELAMRYARQVDSYGQQAGLFDRKRVAKLQARLYEKLHHPTEALLAFHRYVELRDIGNNEAVKRRFLAQAQFADYARRTASLRAAQTLATANLHRQRAMLWALVAGLGLLVLLAGQQWRSRLRQQQANALLAAQKAQIEAQAARLGELDEAKNQFFANVSHELRTPLTLILGPLEGLLTAPPRPLPAAVQQPVALAHHYAQRLRELVNRILDLTKLQAGRLTLQPAPTALAPLLRRLVGQFESLAEQRGVALLAPVALPDGVVLHLDADKVEQVLTNLLINALNHTPAGGTVAVETQLPGSDGQYAVTVRDTGPGIAEAEQARVFERYYQSPGQAQGGTGLGLALSHELAQLLGGSLTLVSAPGQGAAFTLRFPAPLLPSEAAPEAEAPEPVASPAAEASPAPAGPRPRVLVVENQPDLREYLRQLLAPAYEVLTAPDGQAALDLLAREAPVDLITTDAMMPRLSGTELLARLRTDPTQAGVPVLMLTARADDAHRLTALTVGVDDYLTKPFVATELLARVRALLARQQVRREFAALPPEPAPAPEPRPAPLAEQQPGNASTVAVVPATKEAPAASAVAQLTHWQALATERLADERFGPAELAELLCLSERTLYRRLGELAGLSPAAWLRELRLDRARRLLEAGGFGSVAAVTKAAGFGSAKHFAGLYAERFGCRPSSYHA